MSPNISDGHQIQVYICTYLVQSGQQTNIILFRDMSCLILRSRTELATNNIASHALSLLLDSSSRYYTWILLKASYKLPKKVTSIIPLSASCYFSSVSLLSAHKCQTHCFSHTNFDSSYWHTNLLLLTHSTVRSTLSNCSSDLIALSFFLWCSRQPNYFHDKPAFDFMVAVVTRLIERYESVKGIVLALQSIGCVTRAQTFLLLMRIFWRGRMFELVVESYDQMGAHGYVPNTFARNIVMDILFKIGQTDLAMKILREIQVPNFLTFNTALVHLCKLDVTNELHLGNVLRTMLKKSYYPNAVTFEMLLHFFCKVCRVREAYQVLGLMVSLGITLSVNVWTILINGYCRLHRLDIASSLLDKMDEVGCPPNVVTYTTLVKAFMDSNRVADALVILKIIKSQEHSPDLVLYNVLIDCFSKKQMYQEALGIFRSLKRENMVPDSYTLSSLLSAILMSKNFSLLPKLVNSLAIDADLVFCNSLLSYFCKAGCPSLTVDLYSNMIGIGLIPDNYTFAGLLSGLCGIGRIDVALKVYYGILMNYPNIDAHVHTIIIDGLIKVGQQHSAIGLFRKAVKGKHPLDDVSFMVVVNGLIRCGRVAEAFTLHVQLREYGLTPPMCSYNTILVAFCRKQDTRMVEQMLEQMIASRVELSLYSFIRLVNFFYKSCNCDSAIVMLAEMRSLGLLPSKVIGIGNSYELSNDMKSDDEPYSLMEGSAWHDQFLGSSSSEEFPDVAASAG